MQWIGQAGIAYPLHTLFFCFHMLEAYQVVGIPRSIQIRNYPLTLQAFITAPETTGRGSQPKKPGVCSKGDRAAGQGLAQETGHLADLPPRPTAYITAKV